MDVAFNESFLSPLVLPDHPYQGAIKLRDISYQILNQDLNVEYTNNPAGKNEFFPEKLGLLYSKLKQITAAVSDLISCPKRDLQNHSNSAFNISSRNVIPSENETHMEDRENCTSFPFLRFLMQIYN